MPNDKSYRPPRGVIYANCQHARGSFQDRPSTELARPHDLILRLVARSLANETLMWNPSIVVARQRLPRVATISNSCLLVQRELAENRARWLELNLVHSREEKP